jgi:hypothetical protein
MGVRFYEQVPQYRWDIPTTERIRNRLFKLKWTKRDFVDYLYGTVITKVECDILGWNNYRGYSIRSSCPQCNEFNAEVELLPIYLIFMQNLSPVYSSTFNGFSQLVENAIDEVSTSIWASINKGNDPVAQSSKFSEWSEQKIRCFLSERMAAYQKSVQGKSIRAIHATAFTPLNNALVRYHACSLAECSRFKSIGHYTIETYFDYLEDGFSFIKLV